MARAKFVNDHKRRLLNAIRRQYYKYLYPHFDNIEHSGFGRAVKRWESHHWLGDNPVGGDAWDRQYRQGKWDLLLDQGQLEKTSVILGYIRARTDDPSILDIGCGNGVIVHHLNDADFRKYTGVDISEQAIRRLKQEQTENHDYIVGKAEEVDFDEQFDVIILNESLYYLQHPVDQFRRLLGMLNEDGILILSTYGLSHRAMAIFRHIRKRYRVAAEVKVSRQNKFWMCSVFNKDRKYAG